MEVVQTQLISSLASSMVNWLKELDGKQYADMMKFMDALRDAGFNDEFDNSLIMRMIWRKLDDVKKASGFDAGVCFIAKLQPNPIHRHDLIVTLQSTIVESASATMVLFVHNEKIKVSTDVIKEEIKPVPTDLPVGGTYVYWFEAEKMFKAEKRFNKQAFAAFKAVYKSLAPRGDDIACKLHITPRPTGWQVEYRVSGVKVLNLHYAFNQ